MSVNNPRLDLPLLPTTIAGSLPKPSWLAPPQQLFAPWLLSGETLQEGIQDAIRLAVRLQERAGIDIITDGEQSRRHFVWGFIEHLEGIDFKKTVTIPVRGNRYQAPAPRVVGPLARKQAIHVANAQFLMSETTHPVKYTLPGPMTIADTIFDAYYRDRGKLAMALAGLLNEEARELAQTGVSIIQFDEPAFNVYLDAVKDWGMDALQTAIAGLPCRTAVHICYGYGIKANVEWKQSLGGQWRQYEQTFPLLAASNIDQVSLECANSRVPLEVLDLLRGKDIMVGVIDVGTNQAETPEQVADTISQALSHVAPGKLYPCTNCGMVTLSRSVAAQKLSALVEGTAIIRKELEALIAG